MERHGSRWWLVDPDGYAYWSAAMDCVRMGTPASIAGLENAIQGYAQLQAQQPDCFRETAGGSREWNVVRGNFGRAFDASEIDAAWGQVTIGLLRQFGFNGFGNWSDSKLASANAFPYVIPLREQFERTPCVFRDFPDVWHPAWQADLADYAAQLVPFADDRALIGYFLMNEPKWGFAGQSIAEGMLLNTPGCPARRALAAFLRERYADDTALAAAWQMPVSMATIADGPCLERISAAAKEDLSAFSTVMAERFFSDLTRACKAVDAQHLNLGVRYYTVPPQWLAQAMRGFDVFSLNAYEDQFPAAKLAALHEQLGVPIMVGEWHFGALDAGLPMAGICRVADQAGRGAAYRSYLETAAAQPWCVGAHYFQLYDQPYLGRFDGENWNIGLLDTCNSVHTDFAAGALAAHRNMYAVASGKVAPFSGPVSHRPRHFC
jgi:hypothetical protein